MLVEYQLTSFSDIGEILKIRDMGVLELSYQLGQTLNLRLPRCRFRPASSFAFFLRRC